MPHEPHRQGGRLRPARRVLRPLSAHWHASAKSLRRKVYEIVEIGRGDDRASRIFDTCIIGLILLNIGAFVAETVPELAAAYGPYFRAFEVSR